MGNRNLPAPSSAHLNGPPQPLRFFLFDSMPDIRHTLRQSANSWVKRAFFSRLMDTWVNARGSWSKTLIVLRETAQASNHMG